MVCSSIVKAKPIVNNYIVLYNSKHSYGIGFGSAKDVAEDMALENCRSFSSGAECILTHGPFGPTDPKRCIYKVYSESGVRITGIDEQDTLQKCRQKAKESKCWVQQTYCNKED